MQNKYIFKKDLYYICHTNIFCTKIYFSNEIYIFYILIYIFLCKKSFFSKIIFHYKTFFSKQKHFFSKECIFCKKQKNFFLIFFFNLVLQQMSNHWRLKRLRAEPPFVSEPPILQCHVMKKPCDFIVRSPSRKVIILPSLVVIRFLVVDM